MPFGNSISKMAGWSRIYGNLEKVTLNKVPGAILPHPCLDEKIYGILRVAK